MTRMMQALRRTEVLTSRCQWVSAVGRNLSEPHAIKKMALQRSSERQYSNHLLGFPWRLLKKTLK
jgi:hypothetical protein